MKFKKTLCGLSAILATIALTSCKKKSTDSSVTSSTTTSSTTSSSSTPQHSHSYGKWEVVKEPTLEDEGTIERKCTVNDDTKTFTLPKLNETDYKYEVVTKSTCIVKGTGKYTYTKDGQNLEFTVELEIDSSNHEHIAADGVCSDCNNNLGLSYTYNDTDSTCSVAGIGYTGADGKKQYITDVVIPSTVSKDGKTYNVTTIGQYAFRDVSINTIEIPDSVITIGSHAFYNCTSLKSITIPSSVTTINAKAFVNLSSVETMKVDPSNANYSSTDSEGDECNGIFSKDSKTLIYGCKNTIIPSGLTTIGEYAFRECSTLTSINIKASVTTIGKEAFYGTSLKSVSIPSRVNNIGAQVFDKCPNLETIVVNSNNETYRSTDLDDNECNAIISKDGATLFFGCKSSTIPESVTLLGNYSFSGSSLDLIEIPSSVTTIGGAAFSGSPLKSITLPESITRISSQAFSDCPNLTSITMSNNVTSIGSFAFANCPVLETVILSDKLSEITDSLFLNCPSLKSITIPKSVSRIGKYVFNGSPALETLKVDPANPNYRSTNSEGVECNAVITTDANAFLILGCKNTVVPYGVTNIFQYAFYGSGITSIELPSSVKTISRYAFTNSSLKSITISSSVDNIEQFAFGKCASLDTIKVNANNETYRSTDLDGNECNAVLSKDGTKLIAGCKSSTIPDCVTSIEDYAFYTCNALEEITIPDTVTSIGDQAFGYTSLKSIIIPSSVTSIGIYAFTNCSSLKYIVISPNSVATLTASTFNGVDVNNVDIFLDGEYNDIIKAAAISLFGSDILNYKSDTEPTNSDHSYWHYDENKNPVKW